MSFRRLGSGLQDLLTEWLQNPEARRVALARTWTRAVGTAVSRSSRPLAFEEGVLTVEVTDPTRRSQLVSMSDELRDKVNVTLGKTWVRRIVWVDADDAP